jgi:hypothetical protein
VFKDRGAIGGGDSIEADFITNYFA